MCEHRRSTGPVPLSIPGAREQQGGRSSPCGPVPRLSASLLRRAPPVAPAAHRGRRLSSRSVPSPHLNTSHGLRLRRQVPLYRMLGALNSALHGPPSFDDGVRYPNRPVGLSHGVEWFTDLASSISDLLEYSHCEVPMSILLESLAWRRITPFWKSLNQQLPKR